MKNNFFNYLLFWNHSLYYFMIETTDKIDESSNWNDVEFTKILQTLLRSPKLQEIINILQEYLDNRKTPVEETK